MINFGKRATAVASRRPVPSTLGLMLAILAACTSASRPTIAATPHGQTIPAAERTVAGNLSGPLLDGRRYQLADDKGRVVIVNYWASWCGPCKREASALATVHRRLQGPSVTFIGVDVKDSKDDARDFIVNRKINYPTLWDPQGKTALQVGNLAAAVLPFTLIIDRQQRIAAYCLGEVTVGEIEQATAALVAE
jgi:thiol-disulfide isomerase/thioredoxin